MNAKGLAALSSCTLLMCEKLSLHVASPRWPSALSLACLFLSLAVSDGYANNDLAAYAVEAPALEIEHIPISVLNNTGSRHHFWLSVLGRKAEDGLLPLLAVAVEPVRDDANQWMAVWNLADEAPGWLQRMKALAPWPWAPASRTLDIDENAGLPKPYLIRNDRKEGARNRALWNSTRWVIGLTDLVFPVKVLFSSYSQFQDDIEERRFQQVYDLVRLYEETSKVNPSPHDLSAPALIDLKYTLLINRRALGLAMRDEPIHEVVEAYESSVRAHSGTVASYAQSEANRRHLGIRQLSYGLPGQPPFGRAALLFIRGTDLPDPVPDWPGNNPFGLGYNPYEHPAIAALMQQDPDVAIPLAFYVFTSDLRLKPLLAADFFDPGNARKRFSIGTMRSAAAHLWDAKSLPFLYRSLLGVANHSLETKDDTRFTLAGATDAVESVRVYARAGWHGDTGASDWILGALDDRVLNPLALSSEAADVVSHMRYNRLIAGDSDGLGLLLRKLYEDRIRAELGLGNRALFAEDFERYQTHRRRQAAIDLIRRFNGERHRTGYTWDRLIHAWEQIAADDGKETREVREGFLARLRELYPNAIPEARRPEIARLLERAAAIAVSAANVAGRETSQTGVE